MVWPPSLHPSAITLGKRKIAPMMPPAVIKPFVGIPPPVFAVVGAFGLETGGAFGAVGGSGPGMLAFMVPQIIILGDCSYGSIRIIRSIKSRWWCSR